MEEHKRQYNILKMLYEEKYKIYQEVHELDYQVWKDMYEAHSKLQNFANQFGIVE